MNVLRGIRYVHRALPLPRAWRDRIAARLCEWHVRYEMRRLSRLRFGPGEGK